MPRRGSIIIGRFTLALGAALTVILSAPFAQQLFTAAGNAWPRQFRTITIAATAVPVATAFLVAVVRIRDRRPLRYGALALGMATGAAYILINRLGAAESFHFVEYGVIALLFHRAWRYQVPLTTETRWPGEVRVHSPNLGAPLSREEAWHPREDGALILLPLLAGIIVGILDEWFQWFIPIRAGEARDIGLNAVALGCGLLIAVAIDPPARPTVVPRRVSLPRLGAWAAAAVVLFGLFFQSVHLGYDISSEEIGLFRSRYTAADLRAAGLERAEAWREQPPLVQRRISREDQYLTEGLWHVQRRNEMWAAGDNFSAWRENLILEEYYAPVLDTPSYSSPSGHRWPSDQRADAAAGAAAADRASYVSRAYPIPFHAWPRTTFWGVHAVLVVAIAMLCRRRSS